MYQALPMAVCRAVYSGERRDRIHARQALRREEAGEQAPWQPAAAAREAPGAAQRHARTLGIRALEAFPGAAIEGMVEGRCIETIQV